MPDGKQGAIPGDCTRPGQTSALDPLPCSATPPGWADPRRSCLIAPSRPPTPPAAVAGLTASAELRSVGRGSPVPGARLPARSRRQGSSSGLSTCGIPRRRPGTPAGCGARREWKDFEQEEPDDIRKRGCPLCRGLVVRGSMWARLGADLRWHLNCYSPLR
jgi:hypothetical protein